ncbi:MAG TPA: long-chain fatty acid--CoA ligase, partial [Thermoanaerobaculia bacterium]|nr:long-chain fatty acid--CoA ligase [Thermoanaerobaculia bacterium]
VVGQAVLLGDRRNFIAALLTLDPERLPEEAAKAGSPARTEAEAAVCPKMRAYVERQVAEVNTRVARYESVRKFTILPNQLTIEADELTPTMKLKRRVVHRNYADEIEALYADRAPEAPEAHAF